jgi:hypothetical protein
MRLPKDNGDWHNGHLEVAIRERDNAFKRYEAKVDFNNRAASAKLFAVYLKKDEVVENIMMSLGLKVH